MTFAIETLLDRVSNALQNLPGAVELYLFGSTADPNKRDDYSDLDLRVVTDAYTLSLSSWPWILQQVGRIELAFPLQDDPQESAYSIAFAGESPYHKVDIGLMDRNNHRGFIYQVEKKLLLWQQQPKREPVQVPPGEAYQPVPGTAAYFLVEELIGSVRYVKARKRRQHLTCWRFLSAKFNALLRCYQWDGNPNHFPQTALNTWGFNDLDRQISESDRLSLMKVLNFGSPLEMDRSLIDITKRMAEWLYPAFLKEESSRAHLTRQYLAFIERELL